MRLFPWEKTVVRPIGNRRYTEYQEGLYVGYRYFTTFGVPVRYPFGYGLSYTTFSRQVSNASVTADGVFFTVTVANTGNFSGKDVVQIYLHGAEGALERPDRELIAFQKTKLLAPGETQVLSFSVPFRAMAVYDEARAAWILQDGENVLYLGENALELAAFFTFDTREAILEQVSNQVEPHHTRPLRQLSKLDPQGTRPIAPPIRADSAEQHGSKKTSDFVSPIMPTESTPYQLLDVKEGRCTMAEFLAQAEDFELVVLLVGANLTQINAVETQDKDALSQLRPENMVKMAQLGPLSECIPGMSGYTATISRMGIPTMSDGPAGIPSGKAHQLAFPTATITGCTFSQELAEQLGDALGGEAQERKVDVWLAPSMNIHRNPLAGRNYEYYSEDPLLTGKITAAVVRGAQKHPVSTCIKHFAANNQETSRWDKDDSVMTERTLREIYLLALKSP